MCIHATYFTKQKHESQFTVFFFGSKFKKMPHMPV